MLDEDTPFHSGELAAQERAGVRGLAKRVAPFIRDHMPDQHRTFFQAQPFLVAASGDEHGRVWATIIEGADGFIDSPDSRTLTLATMIDPKDPLSEAILAGTDIGVVGIELATRRRNRFSGKTRPTKDGIAIDIHQTFGNCPKYINEREWWRTDTTMTNEAVVSAQLSSQQIKHISAADTLFIGSGRQDANGAPSNGYDASHRGGEPGFVRVVGPKRLRIPDYTGNNFFNTIGNLLEDPRVGLLFVDFTTGGMLHMTGRATVEWDPEEACDPSILRVIEIEVDTVIDRPAALSLRWSAEPAAMTKLTVIDKVVEAEDITSFHLAPANGETATPFLAGQHLPLALDIPGHNARVRRTYSLSGSIANPHYRISVKREAGGVGSNFLHNEVHAGDVIEAKLPAGDFVLPDDDKPLVLVSAGVGQTPMLAMLHEALAGENDRPLWYVHGARNGRTHAFGREVSQLIAANPSFSRQIFLSAPGSTDHLGQTFDVEGRITAADLLALKAGTDALYMICGPLDFMTGLKNGLEAAGVPNDQIKYETFGA
ncbi:FAD-binding oxidoreductase [Ruegeria atlantica]|uniref:FAD-binding oxidoreductase n=1 Tax=Ruegeria atlantica TaxID=81569 RepID=UPI00147C2ED2|nr:pyridoxamine 5'-phosphate oxidase family protein [Ruegeria atlantica]